MIDEILNIPAYPNEVYEDFWAKVRKASGWLNETKQKLIKFSELGGPKPNRTSNPSMYAAFKRYCHPDSEAFCEDTAKIVDKNCPHWSIRKLTKPTKLIKQELIKFSELGGAKPTHNTNQRMCSLLQRYCNPNSEYFCKDTTKIVNKNCPHWFVKIKSAKQELIKFSELGGLKPTKILNPRIYRAFYRYCDPNSEAFCEDTTNIVNENCPHWFIESGSMKQKLIEFSELGGPKPTYKSNKRMYMAFKRYCDNPNSKRFCSDTTNTVNKNCSHWFMKRKSLKQELIKLSELGGPKPVQKTNKRMYMAFYKYCDPNNEAFCEDTTKIVDKNCPHWSIKRQLKAAS